MTGINAFLVLGTVGSGRLGTVYDIMENGFVDGSFCAVFASKNEPVGEFDAKISDSSAGGLILYSQPEDVVKVLNGPDAKKFTDVIYVADSTRTLADEVEFFKSLCDAGLLKLSQVWGFMDCRLFDYGKDKVYPYFDAVAHFSDCVFLSNRADLPGKAVEALKERYEKMFHPHLYVYVKSGFKVDNPMEATIDEARRISMYFDNYDPVDELDIDEDDLPEEPFDLARKPDPYLERADNGMLLKPLPDVMKIKDQMGNEKSGK